MHWIQFIEFCYKMLSWLLIPWVKEKVVHQIKSC